MGDRTSWTDKCPQCGEKTLECFDAPSSFMWFAECESCGWKDPRKYYEVNEYSIILATEEEAKRKGLIVECPRCGLFTTKLEIREFGRCMECYNLRK